MRVVGAGVGGIGQCAAMTGDQRGTEVQQHAGDVLVYGGTTEIADWVAAGKALMVGTEGAWERMPTLVSQWRADLNASLDITQVPATLTTVAFYWQCEGGHLWRETPALRRGTSRAIPRWKKVAGTRAACRACTLAEHGARFDCGCLDPDLANVGRTHPAGSSCATCAGQVHHQWACGRRTWMSAADQPSADQRCSDCRKAWEKLDANKGLAERLTSMAVRAMPRGHEKVEFWCGIDHHPHFEQDLYGLVRGFGCALCFKTAHTPGVNVPLGRIFRTRRDSATSAIETRLRSTLSTHFKVAQVKDANAVRIDGDFYGFKHVLPDILIPRLRVAVELDSPGRDGDAHRGQYAERDRVKDEKLREVGWTVVRVRIDGLEAVDHADCVVSKSLTKDAIAQVVALVDHISRTGIPESDGPEQ